MDFNVECIFYEVDNLSPADDPDRYSKTLRLYHRKLWSRKTPSGIMIELDEKLFWNGKRYGSDQIAHQYKTRKECSQYWRQLDLQLRNEAKLLDSQICQFTVFPGYRVDGKPTINQARGIKRLVNDRIDLTLECIKRYYEGNKNNPLVDDLERYIDFFAIFVNFEGYCKFFMFDDLIDETGNVIFLHQFNNFASKPVFNSYDDYRRFIVNQNLFLKARKSRIKKYFDSIAY